MGLQGDIGPMEAREAVVAHPRRWSEGAERAERAVIAGHDNNTDEVKHTTNLP